MNYKPCGMRTVVETRIGLIELKLGLPFEVGR
jgi:hypothetical protein